jgi:O-antigen/teichoic acid export membrane protein
MTHSLQKTQNVSDRVTKNALLSGLGFAVPTLTMIFTLPIYLVHLGPAANGVWMLGTSLIGALCVLCFGFGTAATKYVAQYTAEGRWEDVSAIILSLQLLTLVVNCLVTPLLWLCATPISHWLEVDGQITSGEIETTLRLFAFTFYPALNLPCLTGVLNGWQHFALSQGLIISRVIIASLLGIYCVLSGLGLEGLLYSQLSISYTFTIITGIGVIRLHPLVRPRQSIFAAAARELIQFIRKAFAVGLGNSLIGATDKIIVGAMLGPIQANYYTIPLAAASRINTTTAALCQALLPHFAEREAEGGIAPMQLGTIWSTSVLIAILIGTPLAASAPWLLQVWTDLKTANESSRGLIIQAHTWTLVATMVVPYTLYFAKGRPDLISKYVMFAGVTVTVGQYILSWTHGIEGAAVGLIAFPFCLFVMAARLLADQQYGKLKTALIRGLWFPLSMWGGSVLAGMLVGNILDASKGGAWLCLIGSVSSAYVVAFGFMLMGHHLAPTNIYSMASVKCWQQLMEIVFRVIHKPKS